MCIHQKRPDVSKLDSSSLASILDGIGEAVAIVDIDWNIFYFNRFAADFGDCIESNVFGKNIWEAFPQLAGSDLESDCRLSMRDQTRMVREFAFSNDARRFSIHINPSPAYLTLIAIQIPDSIQVASSTEHIAEIESLNLRLQNTIEESQSMNSALILSGVRQLELAEKADLLNSRLQRAIQESHHRIKNNLQVISALVELQSSERGVIATDEHLQRIIQHIRALANIHDLLTQHAKDDFAINYLGTKETLERLFALLQQTNGDRNITADIADVKISTQKAASLSLLVSECISNAIKHTSGDISVTLSVEGDTAHLEVKDYGAGFPADFDALTSAHTGLSLIDSAARFDLRGDVKYENHESGGRVLITFPIPSSIKANLPEFVVNSVA